MKRIPAEVSTTNKVLPQNQWPDPIEGENLTIKPADGGGLFVKVTIQAEVPETWEEAVQFYGGEEEAIKALQGDISRRRSNAARPILRDTETVIDWVNIAQQAGDAHKPGQRGGFRAQPTIDEAELRGNVQDMDSLLAFLRNKGIQIQGQGQQPELVPTVEGNGGEEELEEEEIQTA
jgi:hypothetical protein